MWFLVSVVLLLCPPLGSCVFAFVFARALLFLGFFLFRPFVVCSLISLLALAFVGWSLPWQFLAAVHSALGGKSRQFDLHEISSIFSCACFSAMGVCLLSEAPMPSGPSSLGWSLMLLGYTVGATQCTRNLPHPRMHHSLPHSVMTSPSFLLSGFALSPMQGPPSVPWFEEEVHMHLGKRRRSLSGKGHPHISLYLVRGTGAGAKRCSGEQVELAQRRQLGAFKSSIPSLQVAASFACSVASLSRCPDH